MHHINYQATDHDSTETRNALQAVEGITGVRGAATTDLYALQEDSESERQEVNKCLNTVTCRIM